MEYVSSCQATEIWENLCIAGVKAGYVEQVHNGKVVDDSTFYTKVYHVHLKSSLYPAVVKFWYDKREKEDKNRNKFRKDVAAVKITIEDLVLLLQALSNREFDLEMPNFSITKTAEGIRIQQK